MKSSFELWSPVTHDFGLIRAPIAEVTDAFVSWQHSIGTLFSLRAITSSFADALSSLPPLSASKRRRLFVPTTSEWTAYFQSGIQGSDPSPGMSVLAERLSTTALRVCSTPPQAMYPATVWEVYSPTGSQRALVAANDGGRWTFHSSGDPFPFEDTAAYAAARVRDRFTPAMLADYLMHYGIGPISDALFPVSLATPAALLEQQNRLWACPQFTLEEVCAGVPWQRNEPSTRNA